jgi:peptidoglycan LD-endopeptidase LytH
LGGKRIRTVAPRYLLMPARDGDRTGDSTNSQLRVKIRAAIAAMPARFSSTMSFELKLALGTVLFLLIMAGTVAVSTALRRVDPPAAVSPALIVPVAGVTADQLVDSWRAPRAEGRKHQGIDIMAPMGTPVRAAMAGSIAKLFRSKRGGITIYQYDAERRLILYYAHLKAYAQGLRVGDRVAQGEVIGFVGRTGNATTTHLHFEMQRTGGGRQWWRGVAFNPFAALRAGRVETQYAGH